jgi:hypothetical protein
MQSRANHPAGKKQMKNVLIVGIKRCSLPLTLVLVVMGSSCGKPNLPNANAGLGFPSFIQVIGNPDLFHGKPVLVAGFAVLEFENHALYLHQEDAEHSLVKNAIWLSLTNDAATSSTNWNRRYVLVEGVVNSQDSGHMNLFALTIENAKIVKTLSEGHTATEVISR